MDMDEDVPAQPAVRKFQVPIQGQIKIKQYVFNWFSYQTVYSHPNQSRYDPKAKQSGSKNEALLISPLTGEAVPASQYAEHMKLNLLVPDAAAKKNKCDCILRCSKVRYGVM